MKRFLKVTVLRTALMTSALACGAGLAQAESTPVIPPISVPVIGTVPSIPSGADETYDATAITQIMKLVEISRVLGGGISQIITAVQSQQNFLKVISEAQVGAKIFPLNNSADDIAARDGGDGLTEMVDDALSGSATGPADFIGALNRFRTTYLLDQAFSKKDDPMFGFQAMARSAGMSAVVGSTAEDSYKRANASTTRLGDYIVALQNSPDLKTSVDINTRVMIELTQQANEQLRTQAALTAIVSTYFMSLTSQQAQPSWIDKFGDMYPSDWIKK